MSRRELAAIAASVAVLAGAVAGCGVKAPPRPPVKEAPAPDGGAGQPRTPSP